MPGNPESRPHGTSPAPPGPVGAREVRILLAALLFSVLLFAQGFDNPFREDDFSFLEALQRLGPARAALEPCEYLSFYRPGTVLLFDGYFRTFGLHSGGYIAFNYVLHVACCLLLFAIARRLKLSALAAALGAGLALIGFGHYGKMILWACCGANILATLLSLAALLAALVLRERCEDRVRVGPLLLLVLWQLPIPLFHEIGLIVPPLVLLLLWPKWPVRRRVLLVFLELLPIALWIALVLPATQSMSGYSGLRGLVLEAVDRFVRYPAFLLVPIQTTDFAQATLGGAQRLLAAVTAIQYALGLLLLATAAWLLRRGPSRWRFPVVWLLADLAYVAIVPQPGRWLELRYVYYAAFPAALLAGGGLAALWQSGRRNLRLGAIAGALVLMALSAGATLVLERKYDGMRRDPVTLARWTRITALHDAWIRGGRRPVGLEPASGSGGLETPGPHD